MNVIVKGIFVIGLYLILTFGILFGVSYTWQMIPTSFFYSIPIEFMLLLTALPFGAMLFAPIVSGCGIILLVKEFNRKKEAKKQAGEKK